MRLKEKPHTEHRIFNLESYCCISMLCKCRMQSYHICTRAHLLLSRWKASSGVTTSLVILKMVWNSILWLLLYILLFTAKKKVIAVINHRGTIWCLYKPWEGQMCLDHVSVVLWNEPGPSNRSRLLIVNEKCLLVVNTLYQLWMFTWEINRYTCCFITPFSLKLLLVHICLVQQKGKGKCESIPVWPLILKQPIDNQQEAYVSAS